MSDMIPIGGRRCGKTAASEQRYEQALRDGKTVVTIAPGDAGGIAVCVAAMRNGVVHILETLALPPGKEGMVILPHSKLLPPVFDEKDWEATLRWADSRRHLLFQEPPPADLD